MLNFKCRDKFTGRWIYGSYGDDGRIEPHHLIGHMDATTLVMYLCRDKNGRAVYESDKLTDDAGQYKFASEADKPQVESGALYRG